MNIQEKQTKTHGHRQQYGVYHREGGGEQERVKGVKYMVAEEDVTSGGGHTAQCTDDVS